MKLYAYEEIYVQLYFFKGNVIYGARSYKAVLCEGAAEQAIMNVLLDYDCLIFKKED